MNKLTDAQIEEAKSEMVGWEKATPVRFMCQGRAIANLATGELHAPHINVIHQTVYWCFTRPTAEKIAGWMGVKAVFSM